jgi:hypothetical protein
MTNVTGVRYTLLGMTIFTLPHFHDLIRVAREAVYLDGGSLGFLLNIPMALYALHLSHFYVSGMGEKNIVGLPGIGNPGNFFFRFHKL